MVLRLAETSGRPANFVITQYRSDKGKGWGALAKSLGIKPGSSEFHALKKAEVKDKNRDQKIRFKLDKFATWWLNFSHDTAIFAGFLPGVAQAFSCRSLIP